MKNTRTKTLLYKAVKTILIYALFILYIIPFALVLINSLKSKANIVRYPLELIDRNSIQWGNYVTAWIDMNFLNAFMNSLVVSVFSVLILLVFSAMTAYLFVRTNWKICNVTFSLMVASMIVPFQVVMIPLVSIYGAKLGILNSKLTLILMNFGFGTSMCTFMCHGFIKGSIPTSLEEAAIIDGCSYMGTFFRIVFPLMKPILSTIAILELLGFWNDYLLPSLVLTQRQLYTLPIAIRTFYGTFSNDYHYIMAGLVMSVFPIIVIYIFFQKHITGGIMSGAIKS